MPKTDPLMGTENIVQLPNARRPAVPRVARPQPLAIVPFEAWITVRDRMAAALLGGSRCLLVTGAAGTGKTVMLEDVARIMRAAGRTVLVRQADTDPAPPSRGEMLFVDEADRLPQAKLRQLVDAPAGTVVLGGLGTLAQRAGGKTVHLTLAPLSQDAARGYVAQWLASTGRDPAQLESAALHQLTEASGGVPRLLSTLLGAGAWLAESGEAESGGARITAAHIREAAELRCVLSPMAMPEQAGVPRRRGRAAWAAALAVAVLAGSAAAGLPRWFPAETAGVAGMTERLGVQARQWLGDAPDRSASGLRPLPASGLRPLPAIGEHLVPVADPAVVPRAGVLAVPIVPGLVGAVPPVPIGPAAPDATVQGLDAAWLPIETRAFLMRRGREMSAVGDVSAARLLFRRAAEGGSAEAALALARTYDPALQTGLGSAQADRAEALLWYRRAADEGDASAKAALVIP